MLGKVQNSASESCPRRIDFEPAPDSSLSCDSSVAVGLLPMHSVPPSTKRCCCSHYALCFLQVEFHADRACSTEFAGQHVPGRQATSTRASQRYVHWPRASMLDTVLKPMVTYCALRIIANVRPPLR